MAAASIAQRYIGTLAALLRDAEVTGQDRATMALDDGIAWMRKAVRETHGRGNKIMFIGNGGSAGIASHLAIDYSKNGHLRATAFNDAAALTCLANDLGYENVFSEQISLHARDGDLLVAISSSGASPSILNAVEAARAAGVRILTFSGFAPDNPLRGTGEVNFFVRSDAYGFVEVAHLALCHAVLDIELGWRGSLVAANKVSV
ncbi:MAG TPA: SIS domain-containing protein [Stellaceae bacterium]|jgi:D-sedoheptulose 7-phosphate isomerase|nr:SIS domain-containing protein [Stellaceae bacterium]